VSSRVEVGRCGLWVGGEFGLARLVGSRFHPMTGKNRVVFRGTSGIVETPDGEGAR
jgi:hypothetical protein